MITLSLVHRPEGEPSEHISEQVDVNEVSKGSEKHPNDGKNVGERSQLPESQAEPPSKRKKADCLGAANWELAQRSREALKP